MESEHVIRVDLTADEKYLLVCTLRDWGGPAYCSDALAVAMGFAIEADLLAGTQRLGAAIGADEGLSRIDWTRALFSAEIIFASEVMGTGSEWTVINGGQDGEWIDVLRSLQRKVPHDPKLLGVRGFH